MPISKIPVGAIQSGTIATTQIADNAVTTAKILDDNVTSAKIPNDAVGSTEISSSAVTRDELQSAAVNNISSDSIILNSTNGTADAGDFLVLDGTDGSSSNANHRILFDETFVDKIGLFNINTLGSAGQAVKVNTGGTGLEFGAAGTHQLLVTSTISDGDTSIIFSDLNSYDNYKIEFIRVTHNTSAGAMLKYQGGTDASTFITSSNYDRIVGSMVYNGNDTIVNEDLNGATSIQMLSDANRWEGSINHYLDGHAYIYAKAGANTGQYPRLHFHIIHSHTTNNRTVVTRGGGLLNSSSTITSAKFSLSTGSFKSGKVKLYGVN